MKKDSERKVIGFTVLGGGRWSGGLNYQRLLLDLIRNRLSDRLTARVFVSPDQVELAEKHLGASLDVPPIVDEAVRGAGSGRRLIRTLIRGVDKPFAEMVTRHGVDVVFENARFYGSRFPVPILAWLPDFQHRYLPEMYPRKQRWRREMGFRAQIRHGRRILLSSFDAREDCERFYPRSKGNTYVARFAPQVDVKKILGDGAKARESHGLEDAFFYLPNQFWRHKNHELVVRALCLLKDRGQLEGVPPVVMSGPTEASSYPDLFPRLMAEAKAHGVDPWFRHLGLIPFADVLALNGEALALVNPSRFEGWSSTVEEAKALGTPLVLSDLGVHREQAPAAAFFGQDDPEALAEVLSNHQAIRAKERPAAGELIAANDRNSEAFARDFLAAIDA